MVYTLTYIYDGDEEYSLEFDNLDAAKKKLNSFSGNKNYSKLQILVPLDALEAKLNYKEKFEELYNYVLSGAGIRNPQEKTKKMI